MEELLEKMRKFCAYQERSALEVRQKLKLSQLSSSETDKIIDRLFEENFLNEERFTECYIRGKFRTKQWGKIKIQQHLVQKGIDKSLIDKHLKEDISEEEYGKVLYDIIEKYLEKAPILNENDATRFFRHFISKGYDYGNIKKALESQDKK